MNFFICYQKYTLYIMINLDGDKDTYDSRRFLANGRPTFRKIITNCGIL